VHLSKEQLTTEALYQKNVRARLLHSESKLLRSSTLTIKHLFFLVVAAFALSACTPSVTPQAPSEADFTPLYPRGVTSQVGEGANWHAYSAEGVSVSLPTAWETIGKESELAQYYFNPDLVEDPSYNELLAAIDTTPAVFPTTDLFLDSEHLSEPMSLALYAAFTASNFQEDLGKDGEVELEMVDLPVGKTALLTYTYHVQEDGVDYRTYVRYYMFMKGQNSDTVHLLSMATSGEYADAYSPVFDQIAESFKHEVVFTSEPGSRPVAF